MQDFFETNFCALKLKNPALSARLARVIPNQKYEVFLTNDALDFNIINKVDSIPLFPQTPLKSTNEKIINFMPYALYPYLYFFGLGNGVFYKVLLQNENLKRVVVIEPELEILFIVLHLLDFSQEILQGRILFWDRETSYQEVLDNFIKDKHTKLYARLYDLHIFNGYYEKFSALSIEFNKWIVRALEHCVISVGNDSRDSIIGISHHIATLPQMLASPTLLELLEELRFKRARYFKSEASNFAESADSSKAKNATRHCEDSQNPKQSTKNLTQPNSVAESAESKNPKNAEYDRATQWSGDEAESTSAKTIPIDEIESHQLNSVAESTNLSNQKMPSMNAKAKCKQAFAEAKCDLLARDDTINGIAVIVATGPSLSKQLPLLKKYQDYLTIFCIDASFPILAREGIKPDVVFSLERVDLTAKFYEDTPKQAHKGVIFAISSIVHKRLKEALKGDLVQYNMRPFGYTYYFDFKEYGYIGVGMSAANMAYEMAVYARFQRVILIGQDLAFSESGSSHAKNAVYGEDEINPQERKDVVLLPAYGGKGEVKSTSIWKLFLEFYETDIAQTPYKIEVINATEGGARIKGTKEMSFLEALKGCENGGKKESLILASPTPKTYQPNLSKARQKTQEFIDFGLEKKAKIEEVFLEVAGLIEKLEEANKQNALESFDFGRLTNALEHIEEIKEFFKEEKFSMCFNDAIQSYIVHQEMEIAKIIVRVAKDEIELKAKQIDLLYAHKYWLFSLAGGIDSVIEVAKKAFEQWEV